MMQPGKNGNSYRFGFNGMEMDDELKGTGNSYDFGARIYDPRIGRFMSLDPMGEKYPNESDYTFAGNSAIAAIDKDGLYKYPTNFANDYEYTHEYLEKQIVEDIKKLGVEATKALMTLGEFETEQKLYDFFSPKNKHTALKIDKWKCGNPWPLACVYGDKEGQTITIDPGMLEIYENIMNDESATDLEKQAALVSFASTLIEETLHAGDLANDGIDNDKEHAQQYGGFDEYDSGDVFKKIAYGSELSGYNPQNAYEVTLQHLTSGIEEHLRLNLPSLPSFNQGRPAAPSSLPTLPTQQIDVNNTIE